MRSQVEGLPGIIYIGLVVSEVNRKVLGVHFAFLFSGIF